MSGTFVTIVLSIPGVGRWLWMEDEAIVAFFPRPHSMAHTPRADEEYVVSLESENTAEWAMRVAARETSTAEFSERYDPAKRLRRFKDS